MSDDFSKNLRSICAEAGSIAQVCRDVGINRQQFNRYVNGTGMPSAHNLRRIARHFDLPEADLFVEHSDFMHRHILGRRPIARGPLDPMTETFRDQATSLRRYLGCYHTHFQSPTWGGTILRSLSWLYEQDGYVMSKTVERVRSRDGNISQTSRYSGWVAQRGNRIYVIEHERARDGSIVETILTPSHRQQVKFLRGMTIGVAWRPELTPFASRSIWQRVDDRVSAREALKACGVFSLEDRQINPLVRTYLTGQTDVPDNDRSGNVLM